LKIINQKYFNNNRVYYQKKCTFETHNPIEFFKKMAHIKKPDFSINTFFKILFLIVPILFTYNIKAQQPKKVYTLEEVIIIAKNNSLDAVRAKHKYKGSYWQYKSYKAGYLPQLSLDATIPSLNRTISPITLPDGSDIFVNRSLATSSANVSLSQNIGLTGGKLFLNSGVQRIDLIKDSITTSFSSTPVSVGFSQPLFGFNAFKWEKKIEPLKYREAQRQFIEDQENISIRATNFFFDLLNAQINVVISEMNYFNNDTLYKIAFGRYNLGKIAENELLEMELNFLNSEASLEQNRIDYQSALFKFRSYLSIKDTVPVELVLPLDIPNFKVDPGKAVSEALKNRPDAIAQQGNLIEAERDLAKAKADNRFNVNFYGVYGLTQTAESFNNVYKTPLDQQQLIVGIQVPLLNWGVSKGKIKMAESYRELVKTNVEQAEIDFEQEIYLKSMNYNMLVKQLEIAAKADTIALKRYEVTKQRFLIGRIDIIPLNLAEQAKDMAKQAYISSLRNFWSGYYEMRKLTHYDFLKKESLAVDFNNL